MRLCMLLIAAALCAAPLATAAPQETEAPASVQWGAEGLHHLPAALARAKAKGRRLLVGLSGGPGWWASFRFESRGLSQVWAAAAVVKQANRFERLLVRVPEAYWLVKDFGVKRPGVLVLTAEGRKVDALEVLGTDPESDAVTLAVTLDLAATAAPADEERPAGSDVAMRFRPAKGAAAPSDAARDQWVSAVRSLSGVTKAEWREGVLHVRGARLWVRPATIVAAAKAAGVAAECASHTERTLALESLPGTPSTMAKCMKMEKTPAVVLAVPQLAAKSIRFLLRTDVQVDLRRLIESAGYRLKPERK